MSNKDAVRAKVHFAVCRKIRGEGRFAVYRGNYDRTRIGIGETAALAWRNAAESIASHERSVDDVFGVTASAGEQ